MGDCSSLELLPGGICSVTRPVLGLVRLIPEVVGKASVEMKSDIDMSAAEDGVMAGAGLWKGLVSLAAEDGGDEVKTGAGLWLVLDLSGAKDGVKTGAAGL